MKTTFFLVTKGHVLSLLSLLFISLGFSSCMYTSPAEDYESTYIGTSAPDFDLKSTYDETYSSERMKGKYTVLHIATTWCPFCNAEAPHLEKIYEEYRDKGVEVLIIDVKEDRELVQEKLVDNFQLSFPVLLDTDGEVAASFAPADVLPDLARDEVMLAANLLIDPEGKIRFFSLLDTKAFDAELIKLKEVLDELL
ncbi:MAG: TlpA family protein disulfide reductase [Saprospiraceae bacterium]|nr:TlpA family protein disulfide reductase [Saprospiraceae bacterium]